MIAKIPQTVFSQLVDASPRAVRLDERSAARMVRDYGSLSVDRLERHLGRNLQGLRLSNSRAYALVKRVAGEAAHPSPETAARLSFIASISNDFAALSRYDSIYNAVAEDAPLSTDEIRLSLGDKKPTAVAKQMVAELKGEAAMLKSPWLAEDTVVRVDVRAADRDLTQAAAHRQPVTPFHAELLEEAKESMPVEAQDMYGQMRQELSPLGAEFMDKALAVGYDLAALEDFFREIEGQSDEWLLTHLSGANAAKGRGIAQQWTGSCAATAAQVVRAEIDPIYALDLHQSNADVFKRWNGAAYEDGVDELGPNASLARSQEQLTRAAVGAAGEGELVPMWQADHVSASFPGVKDIAALLNATLRGLPLGLTPRHRAMSVKKLDSALRRGLPVLMATRNENGGGHGVTFLAKVDSDGKQAYLMHEPTTGIVKTVNASELVRGEFAVSSHLVRPLYFYSLDRT